VRTQVGALQETAKFDLAIIGDCNPDLILTGEGVEPAFGQAEHLVDGMSFTIGGSAGIMATGAARLGLRTALFSLLGQDAFADYMLGALDERGVDTRGCVIDPAKKTGLTVVLSKGDDRAILTYAGTIEDFDPSNIDLAMVLNARHIHVTSFFLQKHLAPKVPWLFREARGAGATTSLDPNWDPSGRWDSNINDALAEADLFFPNEVEVARIAGLENVPAAAVALAARGPIVVVKRGARGALVAAPDGIFEMTTPASAGDALDTTGAGDSFDAGFLAGYLEGRSYEAATQLACACGSLSVRALGGVDAQPTMEEAMAAQSSWSS